MALKQLHCDCVQFGYLMRANQDLIKEIKELRLALKQISTLDGAHAELIKEIANEAIKRNDSLIS